MSGHLGYTDRNIVENPFQTYPVKIQRFHETWNGSQVSVERRLTAYTAYYHHHRGDQVLDKQSLIEA